MFIPCFARYMEYQRQQSPPAEPAKEDGAAPNEVATKLLTDAEAASEEAAELVEKLEFFKVGIFQLTTNIRHSLLNYVQVAEEKVSTLKTLAIKLEVCLC